ncbi:hypothetical protein [Candidatus Competibacter phosphatis]|nr:hypothetical protein [Candidatus Competibacter phosphatis]
MAQDIEPNPPGLALGENARLCNFVTNSSRLLLSHQRWVTSHAVPALRAAPESHIRLAGIASRLGNAHHNERLALSRAQAVGDFIEQQMQKSLRNLEIAGYGESISGGSARNDDGYYRAVIVVVAPFPVQLPANLIPQQNLKKPPDAPFNRLSPAKKKRARPDSQADQSAHQPAIRTPARCLVTNGDDGRGAGPGTQEHQSPHQQRVWPAARRLGSPTRKYSATRDHPPVNQSHDRHRLRAVARRLAALVARLEGALTSGQRLGTDESRRRGLARQAAREDARNATA